MKKFVKNTVWLILIIGILLTACNSQSPEELLGGKTWELVSMGSNNNPDHLISNSKITIEFSFNDMQLGGNASCNNYFAEFDVIEDELKISAAGSTMMFCEPEELMAQEFEFLAALSGSHHFEVNNNQLSIILVNDQVLLFQ